MDLALKGLRVFVSAGASGIGLAIVESFLQEGAQIATCDVDEASLNALAQKYPDIHTYLCDVSDSTAIQGVIHSAAAKMGGLDCLVNNAGIAGPTAKIEDIDDAAWQSCLDICLNGQFYCVKAALSYLRQSENASIVNLSSAAGKYGFALRTPYAAAKWSVIELTKSLSIELGKDNIRVNAILPGLVAGERQRRVMEAKSQQHGVPFAEIEAAAFSFSSLKDYVTAQHLADQILFLASPRGKMISGQALSIDGDTKMLI